MKVLYAASEAVPFCKTGGLADVAGFSVISPVCKTSKRSIDFITPFDFLSSCINTYIGHIFRLFPVFTQFHAFPKTARIANMHYLR